MPLHGARPILFDLWSHVYDTGWFQRATYRPVHEAVLAELRVRGGRRVLDVGCGTGLLTNRIERELPGARALGCDFSSGMLSRARAHNPAMRWVRADALRLSFRDASFDAVVSTESFHWFPDPTAALTEFSRVLAPEGHLLVAFVNPPVEAIGRIAHWVSDRLGEPFDWPTPGRMRRQVEAAGFRVKQQRRIARRAGGLLFPPVLTVAVRSA